MAELLPTLTDLRSAGIFTAMVYVHEAHADDVWPLGYGIKSHRSLPDRLEACRAFLAKHTELEGLLNAVAVDSMDDAFLHNWGAWPERYFLADISGEVTWASTASEDIAFSNRTANALSDVRNML